MADPEGIQGVRLNPSLRPVFKYPMKMKNLVSMRPNYFIFMGYLRTNQQSGPPCHYIWTPFPEILDPPLPDIMIFYENKNDKTIDYYCCCCRLLYLTPLTYWPTGVSRISNARPLTDWPNVYSYLFGVWPPKIASQSQTSNRGNVTVIIVE